MAVSSDDGETTNYMRFQDEDLGSLNRVLQRADSGDAGLEMEMDDFQQTLDEEEGTMRRKQRNMLDHTLTAANDPSIRRPTSTLE